MKPGEVARWLGFAILTALVALAWSNGLHGEFTYDDKVEVIGNRTIRVLDDWWAIASYNYARPLLIATYAINFHFAQLAPLTYHIFDVLLQAVNAGLVMLLVYEGASLMGRRYGLRIGLVVAGIWALHPLQTEAVSYVTGRSEQLCGTFFLLGLALWLRFLREEDRGLWLAAHGAFLAAALSKEVAAALPLAMVLMEWLFVRRGRLQAVRWNRYTVFALMLLAGGAIRWRLSGTLLPRESERTMAVHYWTQAEVIWRYIQLWLVPYGQTVFHDFPETGATVRSVAAGLGLVGGSGLAWRERTRRPLLAFAWLWFLLLLLPSSVAPLKESMAEHRPYLASLGPAWLLGDWIATRRRGLVVAAALWVVLGVLTWKRNAVWAEEAVLWEEVITRSPESPEGWYGYGDALRFSDRWLDACQAYRTSVDLEPGYLDAWNNLGLCNAELGRDKVARRAFEQALRRSPSSCRTHTNFGLLHIRRGRFEEGVTELKTALTYCPTYCDAHYFLGTYYQEIGRSPMDAEMHFTIFEEVCPQHAQISEVRQRLLDLTF